MKIRAMHLFGSLALVTAGVGAQAHGSGGQDREYRELYDDYGVRYTTALEFNQLVKGADPIKGRGQFGFNANMQIDVTLGGQFQGHSVIAGDIVSNGRVCAHCHRPESFLRLPPTPLTDHVDPSDPLITGQNSDGQNDPRAYDMLVNKGLMKARPGRFNPLLPADSPFREFMTWRKTQTIFNMAFAFGLLTDGRARHGIEQSRGAAMAHNRTDIADKRMDDLVNPAMANIAAWQETQIFPEALRALLNTSHPDHSRLAQDPFATVPITTDAQREGKEVFKENCMGCHNMPNTFNNLDHVITAPQGPVPPPAPANFPPLYGHTFDVGYAQTNPRDLDFRTYDIASGTYHDVVLPLVRLDGSTVHWRVVNDPGAAGATGRYEDLHRFRVPGLRNLTKIGPYMHDDGLATLEDVVDFFNSDAYNSSVDGRQFPIHLNQHERSDLLEFLKIL
jgi:cytochrome c peroxidase